jgi:ATP-binding cassette subfamily F protein 3
MIQLSGAGKRYGHKLLFENVDWLITPESHIGLVGANGTGKSTVMKILAGSETLDYGAISRAKGISTGYLPQDGLTMTGRTVFAECMSVFDELHAMEKEMESLTRSMSELDHEGSEYSNVADRYQKLEHEFVARDGYTLEAQVGQVLTGLGFHRDDWTRPTEEFSGGWQMRIALAKLLLQKPNLLLLDEPTNHLDLEARNWLEEYLTTYPNAYVIISHDRYFLDITVKRIVEIWNKQMHFYAGNYDQYLAGKTARKEQLEAAYKTQHDRIEQLEVFINRFRYTATKAKQVQSRIKELEKMERIQIPEEEKTVHFSFPQPKPSGRIVAEFRNQRAQSVRQSEFHDRARGAHRSGWSQRGREVHADKTARSAGKVKRRRI